MDVFGFANSQLLCNIHPIDQPCHSSRVIAALARNHQPGRDRFLHFPRDHRLHLYIQCRLCDPLNKSQFRVPVPPPPTEVLAHPCCCRDRLMVTNDNFKKKLKLDGRYFKIISCPLLCCPQTFEPEMFDRGCVRDS